MPEQKQVHQLVDHLFRREAGKMVAVLTKLFGLPNIELAEDIVQETLVTAFQTWKLKGIPDHPQSWLYQVAKNKTLTYLKREQHFQKNIAPNLIGGFENQDGASQSISDLFLEADCCL